MELVTPGIGLIFWTTLVFVLLLALLGKFAWKPILSAIDKREHDIRDSLYNAERARMDLQTLEHQKEAIIREAHSEKLQLIDQGKLAQAEIIREAKTKARAEADKMVEEARQAFESEKLKALESLKKQLSLLSFEMAQKILEKELDSTAKHEEMINKMLDNASFN
jgi:F-type H+-transporting ATPase subunit b